MKRLTERDIPAGWFEAPHPEVDEGTQGYFWAWVVHDRLDYDEEIVTAREPEIVRVYRDMDSEPVICRTTPGNGLDPSSYRGVPGNVVLWKGPLHHQ